MNKSHEYSSRRLAKEEFLKSHGYTSAANLSNRLKNRPDVCLVMHDGERLRVYAQGTVPFFVDGSEPAVLGWYDGECKPSYLLEDMMWHATTVRNYQFTGESK